VSANAEVLARRREENASFIGSMAQEGGAMTWRGKSLKLKFSELPLNESGKGVEKRTPKGESRH